MTNQSEQTGLNKDCKIGWTREDKAKIASIVFPLVELQKAYGKKINAELAMKGLEEIMSDQYNGDQIVYAFKKYALKVGDDFPSPKNLEDILNPEPPRITEAQFVQACKYQERNNWPMMSDAQDIIDQYRKQNNEEKDKYKTAVIENQQIAQIVSGSLKQIGGK